MRSAAAWAALAAAGVVAVLAARACTAVTESAVDGPGVAPRASSVAPARLRARAPAAEEAAPPVASDESEPPAEDGERPEVRRVRVVDEGGRPVPGVLVSWDTGPGSQSDTTDAEGTVAIRIGDDEPEAVVFDGAEERRVAVDRPVVEVVAPHLPTLEIAAFDAWTGRRVACEGATVVVAADDDVAEVRLGAAALAAWRVPLTGGRHADLRVSLVPAPGWVAVPEIGCEGGIAARTRRARFDVPVFPETRRVVRAVDAAGRPVAGAVVSEVSVPWGGEREVVCLPLIEVRAEASGPDGRIVLDGLPRIRGGGVMVELACGGDRVGAADVSTDAEASDAVTDIDVTAGRPPRSLPPPPRERDDMFGACGTRYEPQAITVRTVSRDGAPAPGVQVRVGIDVITTGADGTGRSERVEAGQWRWEAWAQGFLPAFGTVDVGAEETLTIREGPGRRVRVRVVDAHRRPVVAARVVADAWSVARPDGTHTHLPFRVGQFDGDVEVLAPRTGADGSVVLVVPAGRIWYTASFLSDVGRVHETADEATVVLGEVAETDAWMSPEIEAEWERREKERPPGNGGDPDGDDDE